MNYSAMSVENPNEFVDYASPHVRSAQTPSWVRRHWIALLTLFGIAVAMATAKVIDRAVADSRLQTALGRVNMTMDEKQVLTALGQPSSRGTWTGSYGSGSTLYYEFPSVWDRNMHSAPPCVEISFRQGENQIFEVGTTAANSKTMLVVSARDR
jgi:hypothetical protein